MSVFATLKKRIAVKNRRFKQELAQKYGHAEVSADDEYSVASRRFLEVEAGLQSFASNVDTYCSVMQNLAATQVLLVSDLTCFVDKEGSHRTALDGYRTVLQELNSEYTARVISILKETVSNPLREHLADMPQVKEVMEKRVRKKTDMDYYKQKLATLQDKGKADKVRETEDKLRQATEVYSQVTTSLMEWFSQVDLMAERLAGSTSLELCRMQNRWYSRGSQLLQRVEPAITALQDTDEAEPVNWRDATLHAPYKAVLGARGGPDDVQMVLSPLQSPADAQPAPALGPAPSSGAAGGPSLYSNLNPMGAAFTPTFVVSHSHAPLHLAGQHSFTSLHASARPPARYMADLRTHDASQLSAGVPRSFRYSMISVAPLPAQVLAPGVAPLTVEEADEAEFDLLPQARRSHLSPPAVAPRSSPRSLAPSSASPASGNGLLLPPAPLLSVSSTPDSAGASPGGLASALGMSADLDGPLLQAAQRSTAPRRSHTQPLPGSPGPSPGGLDSDADSVSSATPLSHARAPLRPQHQPLAQPAPPPIRVRSTTAAPQEYVSVLYPFAATRPSELTLAAGAVVLVKRKHASGWWLGVTPQGQGYFPSNYTRALPPEQHPQAQAQAHAAFNPVTPTLGPTAPAHAPSRPASLASLPSQAAPSPPAARGLERTLTENPPASSSGHQPPASVPIAASLHSPPGSPTALSDRLSGPITLHSPVSSTYSSPAAAASPLLHDAPPSGYAGSVTSNRSAGMPPTMPLPAITVPLPQRTMPPPPGPGSPAPTRPMQSPSGRAPPPLPGMNGGVPPPPPPPPPASNPKF